MSLKWGISKDPRTTKALETLVSLRFDELKAASPKGTNIRDIWDTAYDETLQRLANKNQLLGVPNPDGRTGTFTYVSENPLKITSRDLEILPPVVAYMKQANGHNPAYNPHA